MLILIPPSQQVQITYLIFIIERIIASIRYESLEGLISLTPYLNLTLVRYSCLLCSYYPSPTLILPPSLLTSYAFRKLE